MSRLMSVAFTEQAVVERRKTVTRRRGWWTDKNGRQIIKPGDRLTLCRKVMGRKNGEPLVRLAEVEVLTVERERLDRLLRWETARRGSVGRLYARTWAEQEMANEGFPGMEPFDFIDTYFIKEQGLTPQDEVTRIEWRYLDCEVTP